MRRLGLGGHAGISMAERYPARCGPGPCPACDQASAALISQPGVMGRAYPATCPTRNVVANGERLAARLSRHGLQMPDPVLGGAGRVVDSASHMDRPIDVVRAAPAIGIGDGKDARPGEIGVRRVRLFVPFQNGAAPCRHRISLAADTVEQRLAIAVFQRRRLRLVRAFRRVGFAIDQTTAQRARRRSFGKIRRIPEIGYVGARPVVARCRRCDQPGRGDDRQPAQHSGRWKTGRMAHRHEVGFVSDRVADMFAHAAFVDKAFRLKQCRSVRTLDRAASGP